MAIDWTTLPPPRSEEIILNQLGYEQVSKIPHKRGDTRIITWLRPESVLDSQILSVRLMARASYEEAPHLALDETVNAESFERTNEGGRVVIDHPDSPIGGTTLYTSTQGQKKRSLVYAIQIETEQARLTVKSGKLVIEADVVHDVVFGNSIASVIDGLPRNIIEALLNADNPSVNNVFVTMQQLQSIGALSQNWRVERHDLTQEHIDNGFELNGIPDIASPILMFVHGASFHGYSDEFTLDGTRIIVGSLVNNLLVNDIVVMSYYTGVPV